MASRFFWYDVMTTDTTAAAKFYGDVVGWGTQDAGQPGMEYTLFTSEGRPVAGLMPVPQAAAGSPPPAWMGYVGVEDVDAAVAALKAKGGHVHREPTDVPGVIRFAVVADPQGAVFLVARGIGNAPPPPPEHTPGTIGWRELYAGDWEPAFAFYESLFGWTKSTAIALGEMGTYQLFAIDGADAGGMMTKPPFVPQPHWLYYINVDGIDAAAERVTAAGGKITHGPVEVPGGQWIVQAADPQGAHFALMAARR